MRSAKGTIQYVTVAIVGITLIVCVTGVAVGQQDGSIDMAVSDSVGEIVQGTQIDDSSHTGTPTDDSDDGNVTIVSPRAEDDSFTRGDIVPIVLEFDNTDTATLTFGDRTSPQNIEVNVTVRDLDGSGTATVYLNTFQIGDGPVLDSDGNVVDPTPGPDHRNHGFFTLPGDGGSAISGQAVAHGPSLDIEGGSTGGAIVFPRSYDLIVTNGDESYKNEGQFLDDRSIVRMQESSGDGVTTWTAPGIGENEIDPEFTFDILDAIDSGIITPADEQIAAQDFLVLQVEATGLEGIMHEAVLQDPDLDVGDFLDRQDDHLITEEFFAAQNLSDRTNQDTLVDFSIRTQETLQSVEERTDPNVDLDPVLIDIQDATTGVVAATDDSGNLQEYFIPIRLDPGEDLSRPGTWFPANVTSAEEARDEGLTVLNASGDSPLVARSSANPQRFNSTFTLDPSNADQQEAVTNDPLADGFLDITSWDYARAEAFVDDVEPILVVPQEDEVDISGTVTIAAGSNLTINLATTPAEDPPFFKQNPAVTPEYQEEGFNSWEITEDFADFAAGTNFEMSIRRTGAAGQLTYFTTPPGGNPTPVLASIGQVPEVQEFVFNDQDSGGQSVVVQSFQAPYDSYIEIRDANGDVLGTSNVISTTREPQTQLAVSLTEELTESQKVTAVALVAGGDEYPNGERSAQITVEEPDGPPPITGEDPPQDLDGDDLYEDIDGDGEFSIGDVQQFFQNRDTDVVQNNAEFFNFSDADMEAASDTVTDEGVTIGDVQALFQLFQEQG